jgi:hypothetical protein
MNKEAIKQDLIALCKKYSISIYASPDEPCTIVEEIPTQEQLDSSEPVCLDAFSLDIVTDESCKEY